MSNEIVVWRLSRQKLREAASERLTVSLELLASSDRDRAGGKAVNLGAMIRAGLPVPRGFCVTTSAFQEWLDTCVTTKTSLARLERLSAAQTKEIQDAAAEVRQKLVSAPVPDAVQRAIVAALDQQRLVATWAVRSSATVEDLPDASFAGQHDSYLSVRGHEAILKAVRGCWISLFTQRAIFYRIKNRIPQQSAAMAVVIQEMVPAQAAGVLFTANPVTGSSGRMVIEGIRGLGDQLVSGKVNPERVLLEKKTLRVSQRHETNMPAGLEEPVVRRLGKLARKVERLLGAPQDIEWAVADSQVFLLQARPITVTRPAKSWEDRQVWSNLNAGEVAPDVMTPVTWSLILLFLGRLARSTYRLAGADIDSAPAVGLVAGRIYFNINVGLAAIKPFSFLFRWIPNLDRALGGAHLALYEQGLLDIPDEDLPDLGFRWPKYILSWPRIIFDLITHSPSRGDAWCERLKAGNDSLRVSATESMSTSELAQTFGQFLRHGFEGWDLLYLITQATALLWFQKACHYWLGDPHLTLGYRLFAALGGLPETEAALALWRLATLAHGDGETTAAVLNEAGWVQVRDRLNQTEPGRQFLAAWDTFMSEHGHHCRGELELFNARWAETPDYILGLVRGYMRAIGQSDPLENQRRLAQERQELTEQCCQRLKNPVKRWIFKRSLRRAQKLAVNREEWKNQAVRHLTVLRRLLLALGERLVQQGVLARSDDIFFLEMAEIESVAAGLAQFDVRTVISQRRAEYERNLTLTPPPVVVGRFEPGQQAAPTVDANHKPLKGIPVFPGVVTGPARVILRADDHEQVLPGEILVAPFTDPAWTPYFLPAAGVVMDQGGVLSHGSIVAREYGLPAVTNVGSATRMIRTGDLVQVDGNRGQVSILERVATQRDD